MNKLFGLIIAAVIIFVTVKIFFRSSAFKGKIGEHKVYRALKRCRIEGDKIINDITLVNPENGMTSQIDHILVSTRGIFAIETKNYSGRIIGSDKDETWTQILAGGNVVNEFRSPVKQNNTHVYVLKKVLESEAFISGIVVFAQGNIGQISGSCVCSPKGLKNKISCAKATELSPEQRDEYFNLLSKLKKRSVSKRRHIKNIRRQQKRLRRGVCPRCNGKLVLRTGRYGEFYGCSNFPKCHFTKDL